ncbi:MAG: glycosyltransferase family 4 protein [Proteobacteria bacterium]|nr:glycosyltransferase family 4 protein [Pseudomonadota bacterium]MBI3500022.1 glycosyltransferase family 4 protein [Pseudomonadota bacterium]
MDWLWNLALPVAVAGGSWLATGAALGLLRRRAILDVPNHRSSHNVPTPTGGGIGVMLTVLAAWLAYAGLGAERPLGLAVLAAAAAGLALLSWVDDMRKLPVLQRLAGQAVAVAVGLWALAGGGHVFQGLLPPALDLAVTGFLWLWFVNLYNFMDGIDGITGVETTALGLGLALLPALGIALDATPALILAAAALGFLRWNWHPARIFLGDVGSVPLGYLLGGLLIAAAASGAWAAVLILPLYYSADSTLTLLARLCRGERIWQAHRQHFYQRAVRGGWSHARVAGWVIAVDLALILLAILATLGHPFVALGLAVILVAAALGGFGRVGRHPVI